MAIIAPSGASFLVPTGRSPEGIAVFDEPELSGQSYRVDSDGMITFWLLGRVAAGGLTLRQFQDRLRDQLANGYITRRDISLCSRERAEDRGVADRVRFIGERSDVGRLLAAASVHCQANLRPEPFGIALVEALAVGLPVVTVAMGGALEIVDESCGMLIHRATRTRWPRRSGDRCVTRCFALAFRPRRPRVHDTSPIQRRRCVVSIARFKRLFKGGQGRTSPTYRKPQNGPPNRVPIWSRENAISDDLRSCWC
jgi:hypothetical protein